MSITTISSSEFDQDVSKESIAELLVMPDAADIDFEPPRLNKELYRPADLS